MPISLELKSDAQPPRRWDFGSDVDFISLGRNADCDVQFDAQQTEIGRLHCVIRQRAGDYCLELNRRNLVLLNGEPARDDSLLNDGSIIQLGEDGPELIFVITQSSTLPATKRGDAPPPGLATVSLQNQARTRRQSRFIALTLMALVGIGAALFAVNKDLRNLVGRQDEISLKLVDLDDRTQSQNTVVSSLATKFTGELEGLKNEEKKFIDMLADKSKSIGLVLIRDSQGNFEPQATAWVVDQERGILATNGHVAEIFNEIGADSQLIVRTPGMSPQDFVVERVEIHPGYRDFDSFWVEYDPVQRTTLGQMESVESAGPACDVAIMHVKDPTSLPPALTLADDAELFALKPGEKVAYIGYPIEGTRLFNISSPSPITQLGWITAMTNYFGDDDAEIVDRQLLVHALPASGGTSGSPVFDRQGNVVAVHSGANVIGWAGDVRLVTSANIYFSQRCDLLRELLDGNYESAQAARNTRWQATIGRYFARRQDLESDVVDDAVRAWEKSLELDGDYIVTVSPVGDQPTHLLVNYDGTGTQPVRMEKPGYYRIDLLPNVQTANAEYAVHYTEDGKSAEEIQTGWLSKGKLESVAFSTTAPGEAEIQLRSDDSQLEVLLYSHHAERKLRPIQDRIADRLALWKQSMNANAATPEIALDNEIATPSGSAVVDLDIPTAGDYLILAVSDEERDVDLTVTEGDLEIGQDRRYSSLAFVAHRFERPTAVKVFVAGPTEMTKTKFIVYKLPLETAPTE